MGWLSDRVVLDNLYMKRKKKKEKPKRLLLWLAGWGYKSYVMVVTHQYVMFDLVVRVVGVYMSVWT